MIRSELDSNPLKEAGRDFLSRFLGESHVMSLLHGEVLTDQSPRKFRRSTEGRALAVAQDLVHVIAVHHGFSGRLKISSNNAPGKRGISYDLDLTSRMRRETAVSHKARLDAFSVDMAETIMAYKEVRGDEMGDYPPDAEEVYNRAEELLDLVSRALPTLPIL